MKPGTALTKKDATTAPEVDLQTLRHDVLNSMVALNAGLNILERSSTPERVEMVGKSMRQSLNQLSRQLEKLFNLSSQAVTAQPKN